MALRNVFDYKIVSTFGIYTSGDVVSVLYDTDLDALQVQLNGTQIFTGDYLGLDGTDLPESLRDTESDYYLLRNYNHLHCVGNLGVTYDPSGFFPYATKQEALNSKCFIDGGGGTDDEPVNDLEVFVNVVNYASTPTATDGSFSFNASGSNTPLRFGLTDFEYANGGQTSQTFSNLSTGLYTLYAKDAAGFTLTRPVFIGVQEETPVGGGTYGEKYYYTFKDLSDKTKNEWTHRVQIYQLDYSSSTTELKAGDRPFELHYSAQDKFDPIYKSYATLRVINTVDQGDYYFQEFYTCHDYEYKVVFSIDQGSGYKTKWTGFIRAGLYSEPYTNLPYNISLEAVDGLGLLKEEEFLDGGQGQYFSRISQLDAIRNCLDKLGNDLDIRVAINIFEDGHDQDLDGNSRPQKSPLEQTYVDPEAYIDEDGIDSCYDVLMKNLKSYAARIFQYNNIWWIVSQLDTSTSYDYVQYNSDGTYDSNGEYDPVLNWRSASESSRVVSINRDNGLSIDRPWGKINYYYNLYKRQLLEYGDFERLQYVGTEGNQLVIPDLNPTINNIVFSFQRGLQSMPIIGSDGKGWTLILNGETDSAVTGRIVNGMGVASLRGAGDSYLSHSGLTIKYGITTPSSTIRLRYKYRVSAIDPYQPIPNYTAQYSEPAFVMLKFRVKIGDDWLVSGEGKDSSAYTLRVPITKYNEFETLEYEFGVPETTDTTSKPIEIRLYSVNAKEDYDHTTITGLRTYPTTTEPTGFPMVWLDSSTSEFSVSDTLRYYQLEENTETESAPEIVRPNDYNATTNPRQWIQKGFVSYDNCKDYSILDVDFFNFDLLPKGEEAKKEQLVTFINDDRIKSEYDFHLWHADLPVEEYSFIFGTASIAGIWANAESQYRSHFTLSDGTPTDSWNKLGESFQGNLFALLRGYVNEQFKRGRWRIQGSMKYDTEVFPADVICAVTQNDYAYLPLNLSINYAQNQMSVTMVEIDDAVVVGDDSAFTVGFTEGYKA